jgi:N-acetylglucosamine malate deacetylase 1
MRYLFVSVHPDDCELAAGGMISKLVFEGHDVTVVMLSMYFGKSLLVEATDSMSVLQPTRFHIKDFPVRHFREHRQEILDYLLKFKDVDFVVCPSAKEFHQDHSVVGEECLRAFKHKNLITYVGSWNAREYKKNYFVKLDMTHINKKMEALKKYKSQKDRPYFEEFYVASEAKINGVICGAEFAEAFEVINYVG